MEIKSYSIKDEVVEEVLQDIDIENLDKVFKKVFAAESMGHLKIDCYADDCSILSNYKNNDFFDINIFAEKLLSSEMKSDGSRNKQIVEGHLFIKIQDKSLVLLKLENIEVIDKENHYELKQLFQQKQIIIKVVYLKIILIKLLLLIKINQLLDIG